MMRSRPGLGVALCIVLIGCATGRTTEGFYVDETKSFRVRLPRNGWQIMEAPGTDLAMQDTRSQAQIAVSASCPAREAGPLPALTRHLFFGVRELKRVRQEPIQLDGVAGLDTEITGELGGVPVQVRSVVIRRGECLYDLLFVASPETFTDQSVDFDAFLQGWEFLPGVP